MTKDELKKQLHSYRALKAEYDQIAMELEKIEAFMTGPKGTNWDGMPHSSGASDPILNVVAQHMALQDRYKMQLVKLAAAQALIENLIDSLEPGERRLMRCRYIDGMTWEEVCVAIGYSWRQTHNIHSRILDKLLEREELRQ
jgi:DNA-directed RNA polymerase specialized sigma24 family protein